MTERVSLYIPCYNAERYVARSIERVLNMRRPPDEVIVVDDGSTDRTVAMASEYPVRIVPHEGNRGLAAARNTGVRSARFDLVASIDADCLVRDDWLEQLLPCLDDPRVGGAGGRLEELNKEALADRWRTLHMVQHRGPELISNSDFLFGHSTLFRKSALEKVGLYNEKLRTNNEDEYISKQLLKAEFSLVYQPDAVVEHLRTDTINSLLTTYWRWWFFGYTVRQQAVHVLKELPSLLLADIRSGQLDCAALSCVVIGHSMLSDMRYFLAHHGQRRLYEV
jgi:glycosyltransferase involved in cell wall biosynthesis